MGLDFFEISSNRLGVEQPGAVRHCQQKDVKNVACAPAEWGATNEYHRKITGIRPGHCVIDELDEWAVLDIQ
jgi:hypothetical protein